MKKRSAPHKKVTFRALVKVLKNTVAGVGEDNVMKLSASLAYATLFSIIPLFSFLVTIGTLFQMDLGNQMYTQLEPILGGEVVTQLRNVIGNASQSGSTTLATVVSLGVTIFGATAIFAEIQSSLNTIWGIKALPKKGWLKYIKNRLLSFSLILVLAFLLLVTFSISSIISNLSDRILSNYPNVAAPLVTVIGLAVNIAVTSIVFVLMFKFLPDAKIKSRDVIVGAVVTTILFLIGQWGISLYIGIANVGSVYGAAAFIAILLTWIYYSAIIIYVGAEFTESWANVLGERIIPDEYAVATRIVEVAGNTPAERVKKKGSDEPFFRVRK